MLLPRHLRTGRAAEGGWAVCQLAGSLRHHAALGEGEKETEGGSGRMKWEVLKNPKVWVPALLFLVFLSSIPLWVGEDREDKHGREPHEVAVMFENAYLQLNGSSIRDLATPAYAKKLADILDISLTQGSQNNRKIPEDWVIEEYRLDSDHYLIHLIYVDDLGQSGSYLRV